MENINFLVPEHKKVSKQEVQELLENYSLSDISRLPKIKIKDPALRSLDVVVGDVIAIKRTSFADESTYYRTVIE